MNWLPNDLQTQIYCYFNYKDLQNWGGDDFWKHKAAVDLGLSYSDSKFEQIWDLSMPKPLVPIDRYIRTLLYYNKFRQFNLFMNEEYLSILKVRNNDLENLNPKFVDNILKIPIIRGDTETLITLANKGILNMASMFILLIQDLDYRISAEIKDGNPLYYCARVFLDQVLELRITQLSIKTLIDLSLYRRDLFFKVCQRLHLDQDQIDLFLLMSYFRGGPKITKDFKGEFKDRDTWIIIESIVIRDNLEDFKIFLKSFDSIKEVMINKASMYLTYDSKIFNWIRENNLRFDLSLSPFTDLQVFEYGVSHCQQIGNLADRLEAIGDQEKAEICKRKA